MHRGRIRHVDADAVPDDDGDEDDDNEEQLVDDDVRRRIISEPDAAELNNPLHAGRK